MPFYPLFNIKENSGFLQLANFAPNNWEISSRGEKKIFSLVSDGQKWNVNDLGTFPDNEFCTFEATDFAFEKPIEQNNVIIQELMLFDMRNDELTNELDKLPSSGMLATHWPEWRATIGFNSLNSQVSYQGEIVPTPPKATLLTFHPFIQFNDIKNYFVFLNVEQSPIHRWSEIDIYLSESGKKIDTKRIRNNAANIIPLDEYGFTPEDLPVFYCKSMAGIPFGFGKSASTGMLSLEHTHPPGSLTFYGNRMEAQRDIKIGWVNHLQINKL